MNSLAFADVLAYIHSYTATATLIKLQEMNIIIGLVYEKFYQKPPYGFLQIFP